MYNVYYFYLHCSKFLLGVGVCLINDVLEEIVFEEEEETILGCFTRQRYLWAWLLSKWCTGRLHVSVY